MTASRKFARAVIWALWAAFATLPASARTQDFFDDEDSETRVERIIEMIEALNEEHRSRPSVLAGVDPQNASRQVRKLVRVLRTTKLTLSMKDQRLEDVLDVFREVTGLTFAVSPKAREALETSDATVTLSVRRLPLENILNLMAMRLNDFRFEVRYGAVYMVTREEYRPRKIYRIYNISDLARPPRHFKAPPLGLGTNEESGF